MYILFKQGIFSQALAAWSSGIVSACGVMGREIESPLGVKGDSFYVNKKSPVRIKLGAS
jgi:hypothetical protein